MDSLAGLAVGLLVLGILASLLEGGFVPLIVVAAVIYSLACFIGASGGHRRH
jgi:hypothetical protein